MDKNKYAQQIYRFWGIKPTIDKKSLKAYMQYKIDTINQVDWNQKIHSAINEIVDQLVLDIKQALIDKDKYKASEAINKMLEIIEPTHAGCSPELIIELDNWYVADDLLLNSILITVRKYGE